MKKIFALMLALMLLCAPIVASAEDYDVGDVFEGEVGEDNSIPETETPTEEEIQPPADTPTDTPTVPTFEEEVTIVTDNIVKWIEDNSALIGLIVTVLGYGIVTFKKLGTVIKSASTMNNNAVTIAKTSNDAVAQALASIENSAGVVTAHDSVILALIEKYKTTAEDNKRLENELLEIKNYLKTSTDANVEFANELAELLGLANIPNYKKEEIGARHLEAVKTILEAEKKAEAAAMLPANTEEVKEDVGEEKKD